MKFVVSKRGDLEENARLALVSMYRNDLGMVYERWNEDLSKALMRADEREWDSVLIAYLVSLRLQLSAMGRVRLAEGAGLALGDQVMTDRMEQLLEWRIQENDHFLLHSLMPSIWDRAKGLLPQLAVIGMKGFVAGMGKHTARVQLYAGAQWTAMQETAGVASTELPDRHIFWALNPRAQHCDDCLEYGDREYESWDHMMAATGGAMPGAGVQCDGNCRCDLLTVGENGEFESIGRGADPDDPQANMCNRDRTRGEGSKDIGTMKETYGAEVHEKFMERCREEERFYRRDLQGYQSRKLLLETIAEDGHTKLDMKWQQVTKQGAKTSGELLARTEKSMTAAEKFLSNIVSADTTDLLGSNEIRVYIGDDIKRAVHVESTHTIEISAKHYGSTYVHEFGHWLEGTIPDIAQYSQDFRAYRAAGETAAHLGIGYDPREIGWKDRFLNAYTGRQYKSGATEVLSTGLENLFSNPYKFAQLDPEHFAFTIDAIRSAGEQVMFP